MQTTVKITVAQVVVPKSGADLLAAITIQGLFGLSSYQNAKIRF